MHKRGLILGLILLLTLGLTPLLTSSAVPLDQLPNPLVVVSNEGQAGINVDKTLIQGVISDPADGWQGRFFDPAGWQDAYPVMRANDWTTGTQVTPLLDAGADHIWGGTPGGPLQADDGNGTTYPRRYDGADYNNGYPIPASPSPQYLFLRKDFCLPINAQANAQRRLTSGDISITLLNATDSDAVPDGAASVWLNDTTIGLVPGDESGSTVDINIPDPTFLYRGRNTLAMRVGDARSDDRAAILYRAAFGYAIDSTAIAANATTATPFEREAVQFSVTTDGLSGRSPYRYDWTFGDGDGASGSSVNHAYLTSGIYTVTLTVADTESCTGTTTVPLTVLPHPLTIGKTAQPDPVSAGESLRYRITVQNQSPVRALSNVVVTDALPAGTAFSFCSAGCTPPTPPDRTVTWTLGDLGAGASSILDLYVTVALTASGILTNTAYGVRSSEVHTAGLPLPVEVLPPPCLKSLTSVGITGPGSGLVATTTTFTATIAPPDATEPIYYTWSPAPLSGQGTPNASYQWATPGTYVLTLRAENCGATVTATHVVTVSVPCPHPLSGVSIAGPTEGLTGAVTVFTGIVTPTDASEPITITWSPPPLSGQGTLTATYQWAAPSTYTLTLRAENCGGALTATHVVTVSSPCPRPLAGVGITGPTSGLTDTSYAFTGIVTPTDASEPITITWSPPPLSGQGTLTATYQWAAPGTYTLTLRAENCGGALTATHVITISGPCPRPLAGVGVTGPTSGLTGTSYAFTGIVTPTDASAPISYTWSPPPLSGQGMLTATYQWATPGTYTLTLRAENCGGALTATHVVTISGPCPHPLAGVGITGPTSGITDTSYAFASIVAPADASEPISYTWSPPPLSGQGTPVAAYRWTTLGLYTLTLRAENCGGAVSGTHTIAIEPPQPSVIYLPLLLKGLPDDAPDACPGWQLSIAEPLDEDFDHSGDADWYTFQATAGISYTVRTEDLQIHADTVISLYDGTCTTLLRTNDDLPRPLNSRASQVAWQANTTGPLHVLVRSYEPGAFGPDTGYSLVVYDESHPPPPIQDVSDFCFAAHSIPIGQPYTEDFDYVNDNDWFAFDVAAGRTYTITTSNLAVRANTVLELWSGDCLTQLALNDDASPPDPASQIAWMATEGGQLLFKVRHFDWTVYGPDTGYTVVVEEE